MKLSKKQANPVLPATEPTPTKPAETKSPATEEDKQVTEGINEAKPEPFQLIPPFKISGKTKGMAKAAGIDLDSIEAMGPRINAWAAEMEEFKRLVLTALPQLPTETIKLLRAEAEKQRAEMMQQPQQNQAAGQPPNPWGMLGQFLPALMGGGGGGGVSDEITKQVIDAGIKQMFAGTRLLEAIQTKIMADMGAKAVTEAVTPK